MRKIWVLLLVLFGAAQVAAAHEAYVLPKDFFWETLKKPISPRAFDALKNPVNLRITIFVVLGISALYALNFLFRKTAKWQKLNQRVEQFSFLGPIFVRSAFAASFFFSAMTWSFLGPELSLYATPYPHILRLLLFAASIMVAFGFLTELAALVSLVAFTSGFLFFGGYMFTYLNYLGEIIALLLFGIRKWSFDGAVFGPLTGLRSAWEKYAQTIVRICYGLALVYAGATVKLLHPELSIKVVNDWNLTQFHWLFPSDPLLVTLGAGLAEIAIGLFIMFGFEFRLTVLISLFYITLSLIYFRELVWPHLMLYGISLNLIINPENFTLDHLLFIKKSDKIN